jgi:hypothetical protein
MAKRVDFLENVMDLRSLILGSLGFSTEYIKRQTKLTPGQIQYRLRKGVVKRTDYRNGRSSVAKLVLEASEVKTVEQVKKHLQKQELKTRRLFKKRPGMVA